MKASTWGEGCQFLLATGKGPRISSERPTGPRMPSSHSCPGRQDILNAPPRSATRRPRHARRRLCAPDDTRDQVTLEPNANTPS